MHTLFLFLLQDTIFMKIISVIAFVIRLFEMFTTYQKKIRVVNESKFLCNSY